MATKTETDLIGSAGGVRSEPGGRAQRPAGGEPLEIPDALRERLSDEVIDELLAGARSEEEIVGPGGVLAQLTKRLVERAMSAELTEHLGYEPHQEPPGGTGNTRNGSTGKTLATEQGPVRIETPRDRRGSFEPQIVRKGQRRFQGFDDKILALYSRGLSTRDIEAHLAEIYGVKVGRDLISRVTDAVMEDVREWQQRPLDDVYPVVFLDALVLKVREGGSVQRRACYLALGVTVEGERDVLGMWFQETEGAKFWMQVLSELKQRGVSDILLCCVDGLKGFPEAIEAIYPTTIVQTCIVHLIRHSLKYVPRREREQVARDLKPIYTAVDADAAQAALEAFDDKWGSRFPVIMAARSRRQARESALLAQVASSLLERGEVRGELERIGSEVAEALEVDRARISIGVAGGALDGEEYPLSAGGRRVGTIVLEPSRGWRAAERRRVLPALASLLGMAIDRERLAREAFEAETLRRSDAMKTAILRAVSHDLRTPLMAILTSASALVRPDFVLSEEERGELLETVLEEARRLDRLVANLLDLSRLQAGAAQPQLELVSVDDLVVEALEGLDEDAARVDVSLPDDPPAVRVDGQQVQRVLANLLENALKYSSSAEPVQLRVASTSSEVLLRVIDRGTGVAAGDLERIFVPFQRGSVPSGRGAGLGLAIAQGFAEANSGRVWVESHEGQGATFVLALPLAPIEVGT